MQNKIPYLAQDHHEEGAAPFMDWREAVAIILERAWLGVAVAVAVLLLFFFNAHRQTPYYRSTATLLVEAQVPRLLNYQDIIAFNSRNLEYFNTHINALHSRQMMEKAITQSGLDKRPEFTPGGTPMADLVERSLGLVTITAVEKSRIIQIVVEHPSPSVASDLANALARAYIQQDLDNRMTASMQAVEWLRARSVEYRDKLEKGLLELQKYRQETESVSLEQDQDIVISKLKSLNAALTEAQTDRMDAESQWQAVKTQMDAGLPLTRIAALLPDSGVQDALQRLTEQQRKIAQLQQRYKPGYPELQNALDSERQMQKKLEESCQDSIFALKSRYEMLKDRETNLSNALREQEQESFDLDRKLVKYNDLKRNVEADQEIYQAVIARMKEASISGSMPTEIIRLAEEARAAKAPFRPRIHQALWRGLAMGIVLGLVAIFGLHYADRRFRRNEEVERALGVPVLAALPMIPAASVGDRGRVAHLEPGGEAAEAFRTLRASLLLNSEARNAAVFMITSSSPGEGKTLVSTNLAISFAQDNRRTLLIGADLRRPMLQKIFGGGEQPPGLSEVFKETVMWRDALLKHDISNLDVLTSGRIPSNPSEMLGDRRFTAIISEARSMYQRIILDAPPILGVSDALVLLSHVDAVLFVVRYGVTHSLSASHAMKKIRSSGAPCPGALMNGVNLKSMANYYYYQRYGGYAYQKYQSGAPSTPAK